MTYINTQLAEHEDDRTLSTHGSKVKDQPRRALRFQNLIFRRRIRSEVENMPQHLIFERAREIIV
jgi:hypothetical protein